LATLSASSSDPTQAVSCGPRVTAYETPADAAPAAPSEPEDEYGFAGEAVGEWSRVWRRFVRHRLAFASLIVLAAVFAAGLLAAHVAPYGYLEVNPTALSSAPTWAHPFGTDQIGRDYFSRVLFGIGTEAQIVLLVALFGTLTGTLVGALCGYFGGAVDNVLMRFTDLLLTLPPLITILVAATYLQVNTLFKVSVLFAALLWMPIARIARSTTLSLREREYVEAARAMGASDLRIIRRHILPNSLRPIVVAASVMTAGAVILETTLSFLGVGISRYAQGRTDTQLPSLGDVAAAATGEGLFNWWGILFPGLAILLVIVPIYFIGDGIGDALDPTGRLAARTPPPRRRRRSRVVTHVVSRIPRPAVPAVPLPRLRLELPLIGRLRGREARRRRRLLVEALAVLLVTAAAAGAVYVFGVSSVDSPWRAAGVDVQNISNARGAQTEVSVSVDPRNSNALFAASNDSLERTLRLYSSNDGGRTWTSQVAPYLGLDDCARGEPAVATGASGRRYVAFIVNPFCSDEQPTPYLVVASSRGPGAPWRVERIVRGSSRDAFDAKPAIAVAPDGSVYVAWTRLLSPTYATTVISSTSAAARTWSRPRIISRRLVHPQLVSLAVDPRGTLYLAGVDARFGIWVARSGNHGRDFSVRQAGQLPGNQAATCAFVTEKYPTPGEATRCLGPNPTIATSSERVYVTYAAPEPNRSQGVRIAVLDRSLRPLWRGRVGPAEETAADQFFPAAAVDLRSGGLWACYYDTTGDSSRKKAWYSCTFSRDGRKWARPVRATKVSASQQVLIEDGRIYGFGDEIGYGGYTAVAVAGDAAYPVWIDTRDLGGHAQEIFAARLPPAAAS
jgi:ABC-type dipeptide/oligopeptide/nickel transport system permease subunit